MKLQRRHFIQNSFRFRRWSRKGYAAFFSLSRAVTIGQLSSNVSERFQIKNGTVHSSVLFTDQSNPEDKERNAELLQGESYAETLSRLSLVLLLLFTIQTTKQTVAAASSAYTYIYILKREVSVYTGTFRFFIS
ncbi:hypothetical protein [Parabacteroides gordonii]|uniref:Uncharacterized protein n=1 Tax=Parabacteroides gordonii MS-1 = DSM 23371 TaxID=1203610 RepID=A0A0F5JDF6_9BACT|nr:hypothetical protein [Parabacteroides gordonii]KKB55804.1 hypothetical protein HMPREF1536_03279 [Parabacteroides gordonii MS-1 = DSM 23371]MCA5581414.1 hypothetical protein [Parabacteroides gordonii]